MTKTQHPATSKKTVAELEERAEVLLQEIQRRWYMKQSVRRQAQELVEIEKTLRFLRGALTAQSRRRQAEASTSSRRQAPRRNARIRKVATQ